ncbi:hypothetical protein C6P74_23955 [Burkholderia multivorans]|uniref:DUF1281 family ferredoxin-like fold protein n=1 Tax=Burkholderia multivorans TaxID=87883 RepID=UPI000CFEFF60|nr:hypothetical protein [Burkholderia multivorans]PRD76147.1 hypothetical protein C6P74_23955 [Burkholderia multivorans]
MPNYCYNSFKITGSKEALETFRKKYVSKDERNSDYFDFHKVIPMPKALGVEDNSAADHMWDLLYGIDQYNNNPKRLGQDAFWIHQLIEQMKESGETKEAAIARILEYHPTAKEEAEQYQKNFVKYGHKTWHGWRVAKWGTKWNSIGDTTSISFAEGTDGAWDLYIDFDTAWSPCIPVVKKLIKKHRDLTFDFTYEEPGCCFQGCVEGSYGFVMKDECWDYNPCDDEDFDDEE